MEKRWTISATLAKKLLNYETGDKSRDPFKTGGKYWD
jgi:hypothetical protein